MTTTENRTPNILILGVMKEDKEVREHCNEFKQREIDKMHTVQHIIFTTEEHYESAANG